MRSCLLAWLWRRSKYVAPESPVFGIKVNAQGKGMHVTEVIVLNQAPLQNLAKRLPAKCSGHVFRGCGKTPKSATGLEEARLQPRPFKTPSRSFPQPLQAYVSLKNGYSFSRGFGATVFSAASTMARKHPLGAVSQVISPIHRWN